MLIRYSSVKSGKPEKTALIYTKTEHRINKNLIDSDALKVITHLKDNGFDAYIVGGAVRDLLISNVPKDFDIVTNATPSSIKKIFRNSRIIGKRFRLVHVFFGAKIFEVSTFRSLSDGTVGNNFGTMEEDVKRRDFSINALYYDPQKEQIIDYVHGVKDIGAKKIKPVIPLKNIFSDDPVRMVRAVKYAATTGFTLPFSLRSKIKKSAHLLSTVSPSRLTEEVTKILNSGKAYSIITLAEQMHIYMYLQPNTSSLMEAKPSFEKEYLESLHNLDNAVKENADLRMGHKLSFFIQPFISQLTDWNKEITEESAPSELFTKTWTQCRNFVLPMNPQRAELDFAVRYCLKKMGVSIRKQKSPPRRRINTDATAARSGKQRKDSMPQKKQRSNP